MLTWVCTSIKEMWESDPGLRYTLPPPTLLLLRNTDRLLQLHSLKIAEDGSVLRSRRYGVGT